MIVCGCVPAMRPLLARVVPSVNLSISWQRASKGTDQYPKASKVSSGAFSSNQSASHAYDQKSDIWLTTLPASGAQPTRKAAENEVPLPRRPESQDRLYSQYDV